MRRRSWVLLACFATACSSAPSPGPQTVQPTTVARPTQAFPSDLRPLEQALRERIGMEQKGDFGVAVIDIETGRSLGVNETVVMHAASTISVAVLLELYRAASEGRIVLHDEIVIRNQFRSAADSVRYTLSARDDTDRALYRGVGTRIRIRDLAISMVARSSNLATNILLDTVRAANVRHTLARVQASGMSVMRGVEDDRAARAGLDNTTDALSVARLLAAIARCDILPRQLCDDAIGILTEQAFNEMVPAGLPQGTRVAHSTASVGSINHDGAIIYPENSSPFVVVVLTRGATDTLAARKVAADVARLTWAALGPNGGLRARFSPETAALLTLHDRVRVPAFPEPTLTHAELWGTLNPLIEASPLLDVEELGLSTEKRALRLVRFGGGPVRVLLWSQMHGDETTASRALTDLFNYVASTDDERVRNWRNRLTVLVVPMLNPDGAEAHRRRNVYGIDINRDARHLSTPEARALKTAQERFQPDFGFNLHDQNPRTRVGTAARTAAIALLAPPPDGNATETPGFVRAKQLTAYLANTVAPLVGQHLTRYDDSYNARAFGDGMQSWGVSTVLIETGGWRGEETKNYLRKVNFVALVSALDAIASGAFANASMTSYTTLPQNGRSLSDLLIRGGSVVIPGREPHRADVLIDAASVGGPNTTQVVDVGDLADVEARDTLDATNLFLHVQGGLQSVQPGTSPVFVVRKAADPRSEAVWLLNGIRRRQLTPADHPFVWR